MSSMTRTVIPAKYEHGEVFMGIQPLSRVCGDMSLFFRATARKGLDSGLRRNDDSSIHKKNR